MPVWLLASILFAKQSFCRMFADDPLSQNMSEVDLGKQQHQCLWEHDGHNNRDVVLHAK